MVMHGARSRPTPACLRRRSPFVRRCQAMRQFLFFYALALHMLVFYTVFHFPHRLQTHIESLPDCK